MNLGLDYNSCIAGRIYQKFSDIISNEKDYKDSTYVTSFTVGNMFMLKDDTYDLNFIKSLFVWLVSVNNITGKWFIYDVKLSETGFAIYVEIILQKIEDKE